MKSDQEHVSAAKYEAVAKLLAADPPMAVQDVARRCGVPAATVERIRKGEVIKPATILLDRLSQPRRCPDCGALCRDWPCIFCEMGRRRSTTSAAGTAMFQYRTHSK